MSALCKFRCDVAPIRLETGRYENLRVEERFCPFCPFCPNTVEDEKHVILNCKLYDDIRDSLYKTVVAHNSDFLSVSGDEKLKFLFTKPVIVRVVAKTCCKILDRRKNYTCIDHNNYI